VEEAEALVGKVDDAESSAFAAGALEELTSRSTAEGRDAIGVIALSYGAPFALRLSTERPETISAAVLFYGTGGQADYRRARAAYLGHFAERDPFEDEESIGGLEAALREAGREVTFHRYPGTGHWFFEPDRPEYDVDAAELAWRRTIEFLTHVGRD
ncbi:MAG: dienelactone hydrolase family protein, partial [Chloroflexota bacterium]|nr:dienelactone hydrolase family protein [Chloroflexota bacterium]